MISGKTFRRSFIFFVIIGALLMSSYVAPVNAAILQPFRIGGTVTIDSVVITQATAAGLTFKVTKLDGTDYTPVATTSVLNGSNWYIIDVPIANADQPGGANPNDIAVIHVLLNGVELSVTSPTNARFTVGASGATLQINLVAVTPLPIISNFIANPTSIQPGGSSSLSWTITGATSASIDNAVGVVSATTGTSSVSPATTTTYTLTATNATGSATATATVTVQALPLPVIANFSASPASIQPGGASTLSWTITGATSASMDNGVGVVNATTGSSSVSPAATTTYTLTATNASGSVTRTATVTVQQPSPAGQAVNVPTVSEWGMIILALGFGIAGLFYMKKNAA